MTTDKNQSADHWAELSNELSGPENVTFDTETSEEEPKSQQVKGKAEPAKRRRGRPPKTKETSSAETKPRKRGRPKKEAKIELSPTTKEEKLDFTIGAVSEEEKPKRGRRGRKPAKKSDETLSPELQKAIEESVKPVAAVNPLTNIISQIDEIVAEGKSTATEKEPVAEKTSFKSANKPMDDFMQAFDSSKVSLNDFFETEEDTIVIDWGRSVQKEEKKPEAEEPVQNEPAAEQPVRNHSNANDQPRQERRRDRDDRRDNRNRDERNNRNDHGNRRDNRNRDDRRRDDRYSKDERPQNNDRRDKRNRDDRRDNNREEPRFYVAHEDKPIEVPPVFVPDINNWDFSDPGDDIGWNKSEPRNDKPAQAAQPEPKAPLDEPVSAPVPTTEERNRNRDDRRDNRNRDDRRDNRNRDERNRDDRRDNRNRDERRDNRNQDEKRDDRRDNRPRNDQFEDQPRDNRRDNRNRDERKDYRRDDHARDDRKKYREESQRIIEEESIPLVSEKPVDTPRPERAERPERRRGRDNTPRDNNAPRDNAPRDNAPVDREEMPAIAVENSVVEKDNAAKQDRAQLSWKDAILHIVQFNIGRHGHGKGRK